MNARARPGLAVGVPRISIVIPTYQRRDRVLSTVQVLTRQVFERPFEVVVAVDGATDGTVEALRGLSVPFPLTVLHQPNRGAAAARNLGARHARGEIILFLDDDMEADPRLLAEHDRLHGAGADAVLGHMPLHPASPATVISKAVAEWADERVRRLSQPDADLTLHDLLTGQLSVSAEVFRAVQGFDAAFTRGGSFGNEDVDFGHRLLLGGYDIRFSPSAISYQYYAVTPRQHLRQWRQAGSADVLFARKHPEEALDLFILNGLGSRFARIIARPVARAPFWRLLTGPVRGLAIHLGDRRDRFSWAVFFRAKALEYWRGVSVAGDIPQYRTLRVLAYHAIADLRGHGALEPYGTPLPQFRRQLAALQRCGFHVISTEEFTAYLEGRSGLPRRAILLTFDDCYIDLLAAGAVLHEEGLEALAFAVSGLLGADNAWDRKHGGPPLRLLDASQLQELRSFGLEISAHSRTHPELPLKSMDEVDAEVRGSVGDLRGLGLGPVHYFAYPYGEVDERVEGVVRTSGITAAFAIDPGVMDDSTDHLRIPRVEIVRADRTLRFLAKVAFARQLAHTHRLSRKGRSLAGRLRRRSIGSSVGGRRGSG